MINKLLQNYFSSVMVPIAKMCITFIMVPVVIQSLGSRDGGIWGMVFSVVGYMGMLAIGLSPAIIHYISGQHALGSIH